MFRGVSRKVVRGSSSAQRDHTLLYRACADHAMFMHAHCTVNLGNYEVEFQSLSHSSGVHASQHTAVKTPCALVMCVNAQEYIHMVLQTH